MRVMKTNKKEKYKKKNLQNEGYTALHKENKTKRIGRMKIEQERKLSNIKKIREYKAKHQEWLAELGKTEKGKENKLNN